MCHKKIQTLCTRLVHWPGSFITLQFQSTSTTEFFQTNHSYTTHSNTPRMNFHTSGSARDCCTWSCFEWISHDTIFFYINDISSFTVLCTRGMPVAKMNELTVHFAEASTTQPELGPGSGEIPSFVSVTLAGAEQWSNVCLVLESIASRKKKGFLPQPGLFNLSVPLQSSSEHIWPFQMEHKKYVWSECASRNWAAAAQVLCSTRSSQADLEAKLYHRA